MTSRDSNEAADHYRLSSRSSSVSSYSDDHDDGNEGLVENLKEALAERDRRIQLQKLNSEEVISPPLPSSQNDVPPPLPPKMGGRANQGGGVGDYDEDAQTRVIDFGGNNKYPNRKRNSKNKRAQSMEYQRKASGQKAVDKLYRRSALVSLHPVSSREEPITAYDPLKLVDSDEDDITNLVLQANTLEMRPYHEKQDGAVEVLYPSFQHQSQPKKNLKSAIPEVFSKLAPEQNHDIDDENFDDEPVENFQAIRSHTLPSQIPNRRSMKKRGASPPREKLDMTDVWPSDITDFDSVSTSDHEVPPKNLLRHDDGDESYAYDTVADQTDDFDTQSFRKGAHSGDTKIVCDKYMLCGNMNEKLHNTYPKRLHFKTTHKDRPGLESIAIALTDPSSGNHRHIMTSQSNRGTFPAASRSRKMKRTTSLDSRNKNKESNDEEDMTSCDDVEEVAPPPTQVRVCLDHRDQEDYQINLIPTSSNIINLNIQSLHNNSDQLQVQPPPLITAVKHISAPVKEEDDVIVKYHQPADRVVDFYGDEEISGGFNPDHELGVGRAYSFNIGKNVLLEKQQQQILQQLKELNDLQKQQLGQQQQRTISEGLQPTAPSFGVIQPIVVTTHYVEESAPPVTEVQPVTASNSMVVQVENPLAGRPLGDVVSEQEPVAVPAVEPVPHGGDSGIDLRTNYDHRISTSSSTSESESDHSIDIYTSPNQQLKRAKEVEKIRRWYRSNYLKPRCCFSCLSVFICMINLIFFLIGAGLLGLAAYGVYDLLLDRISDPLLALVDPIFGMAIFGFIIFVATLSAMVGFCKGKLFLIKFFGWFLILTCVLFSAGGIVFWIYKAEFPVFLSGYVFRRLIQNYGGEHRVISAFTLDQIQQNFKCCGMDRKVTWNLNSNFPCQNSTCILPDSCCLDQVSCTSNHPAAFNVTCMDEMSSFVDNYNGIIAGVWGCLMLLVVIEFICVRYMIREVLYRMVIKKQIKIIVRDLQDSCDSEEFTRSKSRKSRRKRKKKKQKKRKKTSYTNPSYH